MKSITNTTWEVELPSMFVHHIKNANIGCDTFESSMSLTFPDVVDASWRTEESSSTSFTSAATSAATASASEHEPLSPETPTTTPRTFARSRSLRMSASRLPSLPSRSPSSSPVAKSKSKSKSASSKKSKSPPSIDKKASRTFTRSLRKTSSMPLSPSSKEKKTFTRTSRPFDLTRVPLKSCLKQTQQESSSSSSTSDSKSKRDASSKSKSKQDSSSKSNNTSSSKSKHIFKFKRQRSIRFAADVSIRKIRTSLSLCYFQSQILWWQDDEIATIKDKLRGLLSQVDLQGISSSNGKRYCVRGLEHYLEENDRESDRSTAEDAVLEEQSLQRQENQIDELRISEAYHCCTQNNVLMASCRGRNDAATARSIYALSPP